MIAQQLAFDVLRREYNNERAHEALEMQAPATLYVAFTRLYPEPCPIRNTRRSLSETRYWTPIGQVILNPEPILRAA